MVKSPKPGACAAAFTVGFISGHVPVKFYSFHSKWESMYWSTALRPLNHQ